MLVTSIFSFSPHNVFESLLFEGFDIRNIYCKGVKCLTTIELPVFVIFNRFLSLIKGRRFGLLQTPNCLQFEELRWVVCGSLCAHISKCRTLGCLLVKYTSFRTKSTEHFNKENKLDPVFHTNNQINTRTHFRSVYSKA